MCGNISPTPITTISRWWQLKYFLKISPLITWGNDPMWRLHIFQMGWWKTTNQIALNKTTCRVMPTIFVFSRPYVEKFGDFKSPSLSSFCCSMLQFCWTLVPRKWGNENLCYLCSMFLGVWFFGCHRQIWIKAFSNEKRGPGCLEYSVSHFSLETSQQIASPPNRSLLLCQSILNSAEFFAGQAHPKKSKDLRINIRFNVWH